MVTFDCMIWAIIGHIESMEKRWRHGDRSLYTFFSFLKCSILGFSVWFCLTFKNSEWLYWKILFWKFISPVSNFRTPFICFLKKLEKISLIIWCFLQQFSLTIHGIRTIFSLQFCCILHPIVLASRPEVPSHRYCSSVCRELALLWLGHYLFLLNKRWFYVSIKTLLLFDSLDPSNTSLCYMAWQGAIRR